MELFNIRWPPGRVDAIDQTPTINQVEPMACNPGFFQRTIEIVRHFDKLLNRLVIAFGFVVIVIATASPLPGVDVDSGELSWHQLRSWPHGHRIVWQSNMCPRRSLCPLSVSRSTLLTCQSPCSANNSSIQAELPQPQSSIRGSTTPGGGKSGTTIPGRGPPSKLFRIRFCSFNRSSSSCELCQLLSPFGRGLSPMLSTRL